MVGIEDERLMLMLRYFLICFHIPLSNRDVSTNGYFICGFSIYIYKYIFLNMSSLSYKSVLTQWNR